MPPAHSARHSLVGRSSVRDYATFSCGREQLCLDVAALLAGQAMTGGPSEILHIGNLPKPRSGTETLDTRYGPSKMRQVHEIDGKRGRQMERALPGDVQHDRSIRTPDSRPSRVLSGVLSSIWSLLLSSMISTHLYHTMEIAPLTIIPYKPKPQKPLNHNVHNPLSKPLVKQPNSLHTFQAIDSVKSSTETPLRKNGSPEKETRGCEAAARHVGGPGEDPDSGRGMCSDLLSGSILLRLITSSRLDEVYRRVGNTR